MIQRNGVRCKSCGDEIYSKRVHDFQTCSCGKVSVDGGHAYLKRATVDGGEYDELSIV